MRTIKAAAPTENMIPEPLSIRELGEVLVKHYGLHDGTYEIMLQFQIGVGPIGPNPESMAPGAMVAVQKIGLLMTGKIGPTTIDAALINPALKPAMITNKLIRKK